MSVWGTGDANLKLRGFSWGAGHWATSPQRARCRVSALTDRICLVGLPTRLNRHYQSPAGLAFSVPPIAVRVSTGLFTGFPSTTPFGLALGADSPCADCRCAGTLGHSACGVFTRMIVTYVSIRASDTSSRSHKRPSLAYGTLPYHALRHPQLRYTT